jgi:hypothetical protein
MTEGEAVMPDMTVSEVKFQSDLMSAEDAQLLLPKLTDEQLATLKSHGTTEKTSIGQILATAGDLTYDLMVVLDWRGRVFRHSRRTPPRPPRPPAA